MAKKKTEAPKERQRIARVFDLEKATSEQTAAVDQLTEYWKTQQLRTDRADFDGAEVDATNLFVALDWEKPKFFFRTESVMGLTTCMFLMQEHEQRMRELAAEIALNGHSLDAVHDSLVEKAFTCTVWGPLNRIAIKAGIRSCLEGFVRNVREHGPSKGITGASKETLAWTMKPDPNFIDPSYRSTLRTGSVRGQHDAGMAMYLQALPLFPEVPHERANDPDVQKELAITDTIVNALIGLTSKVGWWLAYDEDQAVVFMDRPAKMVIRNRPNPDGTESTDKEFHCEDGPAIEYRDGSKQYMLSNFPLPSYVIEDPTKITLEEINNEENAEVQRILRQQYGDLRYMHDSGMEVIAAGLSALVQGDDSRGSNPEILVRNTAGEQFIVASDGSTDRVYTIRVPSGVTTLEEGHAALFPGLDPKKMLAQS